MKRILKSRRGAVIEAAVFFMLVVFALSMLLLSSVTAMGYRNLADERADKSRRELEQIGMYFLAEQTDALRDYAAECGYTEENGRLELDTSTLTLKNKNQKTVLYIEKDGTQATVWRYSEPPQE